MKPTDKEIEAIKLSEELYRKQKRGFIRSIFGKPFRFNSYETSEIKCLEELWYSFGLYSYEKHIFTNQQKIELIHQWFNILYPYDVDIVKSYNQDTDVFYKEIQELHQQHPHIHVSWDFPTPEKYLQKITDTYGFYDNPIYI